MPLDLAPSGDNLPPPPIGMDCIVVGGCANSMILKNVRIDAAFIELNRPVGLKPLASSIQKIPEIVREKDTYEVHPISLVNDKKSRTILGIAVIQGRSLTWGFTELIKGYVLNATTEMIAAGVITKQ